MVRCGAMIDREHALLLETAHIGPTPRSSTRIREIASQPVDWDHFKRLSEYHGVWPLAASNLYKAGVAAASSVAPLDDPVGRTTARNLSLLSQLAQVLALLERRGISAVSWKGPSLAADAYDHLGLRAFDDLDILVARDALPAVRDQLVEAGYTLAEWSAGAIDYVHPALAREYTFIPREPGFAPVEIQISLAPWPLAIDLRIDDFLARAVTAEINGVVIRTMAREDHLLALAIHGFTHEWSRLRLITDIDAVARGTIDWAAAMNRARAAGVLRILRVALLLAHQLFETPIPSDVVESAGRDWMARHLAQQTAARLFTPVAHAFRHLWKDWLLVQSRERLRDKLRFAARTNLSETVIRRMKRRRARQRARQPAVTPTG